MPVRIVRRDDQKNVIFEEMGEVAQNSVAVSRTTKGVYTWDIKCYVDDSELAVVVQRVKDIDTALRDNFTAAEAPEPGVGVWQKKKEEFKR
jgi:hypothetical protein